MSDTRLYHNANEVIVEYLKDIRNQLSKLNKTLNVRLERNDRENIRSGQKDKGKMYFLVKLFIRLLYTLSIWVLFIVVLALLYPNVSNIGERVLSVASMYLSWGLAGKLQKIDMEP
jgi:hypothetical protein